MAEAARIPIMVQDAPLSGVQLSVPFLVRLAGSVPLVRYFKIEVPGAAAKLRALIAAGGDAIDGPFDGEESITLMADLDAGAHGHDAERAAAGPDQGRCSPITSPAGAPRRPRCTRAFCRSSISRTASAACARAKTVMKEGGVIRSDAVRHPLEPLHPHTRAGLLELAAEVNPLALRWGR